MKWSLNEMFISLLLFLPSAGRGRGKRGANYESPAGPSRAPGGRKVRSELKSSEQILKQRKKRSKQQFLQSGGMKKLRAKNKQFVRDLKKGGFGRGGQKKGKMRKKMWGGHRGRTVSERSHHEGWCGDCYCPPTSSQITWHSHSWLWIKGEAEEAFGDHKNGLNSSVCKRVFQCL